MTTSPRPAPPISPAITTIESAKRIVWLTESSSIRRASGSCTFDSTCHRVAPSAVRRLDRVRRDAADPERGDPDRRRDRVDHRRDHRGARADREEDHDRHQVRERGDDLHRVEDRRDRSVEAVRAAGDHAERHADQRARARRPRASARTSATVSSQSPSSREARRTRRTSPSAALHAAEAEHDSVAERRRADPRQPVEEPASARRRDRRGSSRSR